LTSPQTLVTLGLAVLLLGLFVLDCLRAENPFVDPALFRIRPFVGATLIMAPYSIAFGGMLLSIALWMQQGWGWSALKTGAAIAPGPFLVPLTSLLFAGRLIGRFGAARVTALGVIFFASGLGWFAAFVGLEPSMPTAIVGMAFTGIGVGLTFPTVMGAGTASLPPSSFATGSGVLNMTRQTALALGVAVLVAVLGHPSTPHERLSAFTSGWLLIGAFALMALAPLPLLRNPR
jgi:hypothetical protein